MSINKFAVCIQLCANLCRCIRMRHSMVALLPSCLLSDIWIWCATTWWPSASLAVGRLLVGARLLFFVLPGHCRGIPVTMSMEGTRVDCGPGHAHSPSLLAHGLGLQVRHVVWHSVVCRASTAATDRWYLARSGAAATLLAFDARASLARASGFRA